MDSQNNISKFDFKNIPGILSVVQPMWTDPSMRSEYARLYAELILRCNIFENDFRFQMEDERGFCSAAFGTTKGEKNTARSWLDGVIKSGDFSDNDIYWFNNCVEYIETNDARLQSHMAETDIQLSLFVSRIKGCGKVVLNEFLRHAKDCGYKRLFLWTDVECDWEYYPAHGFELVEESVYDLYSRPGEPYKVFFYRRDL